MRAAVLGAGGVALGTAVLLTLKGHEPVVWSPSGNSTRALSTGSPLAVYGAIEGEFPIAVMASCGDAITNSDVVIVAVPAYGHRAVIEAALPFLREGQVVIISSHYSLTALYLSQRLAERRLRVPIVAWGTTALMSRVTAPANLFALVVRTEVDMATIPISDGGTGLALCRELFGDCFRERSNLLAIQFSNINPPAHLANSICNLTRVEKGEGWGNYDCITPSVGRLIETLDGERLALARVFGVNVRSVHEHMHRSFNLQPGSMAELAQQVHQRLGGSPGPTSLDAKWFREDFAFGIVPLLEIARLVDMPMPLHEAGHRLLCTLLGRDLAADNDILPGLQLDRLQPSDLDRYATNGWPWSPEL